MICPKKTYCATRQQHCMTCNLPQIGDDCRPCSGVAWHVTFPNYWWVHAMLWWWNRGVLAVLLFVVMQSFALANHKPLIQNRLDHLWPHLCAWLAIQAVQASKKSAEKTLKTLWRAAYMLTCRWCRKYQKSSHLSILLGHTQQVLPCQVWPCKVDRPSKAHWWLAMWPKMQLSKTTHCEKLQQPEKWIRINM